MRLVINNGKAKGRILNIVGSRVLIGRDRECQLRPQSDEVGGRHAELKVVAGIAVLVDLGSAGGTHLNGQRLTSPATVRNGDRVDIGPLSFTVLLDEAKRATKPKPALEDQVASWLVDDEDDGPESPTSRKDLGSGGKTKAMGARRA